MWPSWCHCHSLSLASVKSRLVLPFWYRPTWVVPEKGPLNGCVCVCSDAGDYMWRSGMSWNIQLGGGDAGSCSRGSYLGVGGGCSVQPGDGGSRLDLLQMTTPPLNAQQQPDELVLEFLLNELVLKRASCGMNWFLSSFSMNWLVKWTGSWVPSRSRVRRGAPVLRRVPPSTRERIAAARRPVPPDRPPTDTPDLHHRTTTNSRNIRLRAAEPAPGGYLTTFNLHHHFLPFAGS